MGASPEPDDNVKVSAAPCCLAARQASEARSASCADRAANVAAWSIAHVDHISQSVGRMVVAVRSAFTHLRALLCIEAGDTRSINRWPFLGKDAADRHVNKPELQPTKDV